MKRPTREIKSDTGYGGVIPMSLELIRLLERPDRRSYTCIVKSPGAVTSVLGGTVPPFFNSPRTVNPRLALPFCYWLVLAVTKVKATCNYRSIRNIPSGQETLSLRLGPGHPRVRQPNKNPILICGATDIGNNYIVFFVFFPRPLCESPTLPLSGGLGGETGTVRLTHCLPLTPSQGFVSL